MDLAKPCIDVGLFTDRLEEMRAFFGEEVRLPFEEMLAVGRGVRQYRYGLLGSVLKINHSRDPLAPLVPSGYRRLRIADPRTPIPIAMQSPDGTPVEMVPTGLHDVTQIEINLGVTNPGAFERFYGEALGGEAIGGGRFKLGETIISFAHDPQARRAEPTAAGTNSIDAMSAVGFRYITFQVRDCNAEHRRLIGMGVTEGAPPATLGEVARISFIRDPDGNWIEISQRATLTGALPKS